MTLYLRTRTVIALCFVTVFFLSALAQTSAPNTTEWENEALKLRLFYPADLMKGDHAQIMRDGQVTLFGISGASDPKLAEATHCLRPVLLLNLPQSGTQQTTATILLAELDVDCLTPEQQNKATNLLNDMAEIVDKVPGMKANAQPATYTIGWQKVHMAAAQGQPQAAPQTPNSTPSQLYTMGLSTNSAEISSGPS